MPARDMSNDRLAMRIHGRQSRCPHDEAEPVQLMTGERVAWLCPDCDKQLPAGFRQERKPCQCQRFPEQCPREITQEDLLCDGCRTKPGASIIGCYSASNGRGYVVHVAPHTPARFGYGDHWDNQAGPFPRPPGPSRPYGSQTG